MLAGRLLVVYSGPQESSSLSLSGFCISDSTISLVLSKDAHWRPSSTERYSWNMHGLPKCNSSHLYTPWSYSGSSKSWKLYPRVIRWLSNPALRKQLLIAVDVMDTQTFLIIFKLSNNEVRNCRTVVDGLDHTLYHAFSIEHFQCPLIALLSLARSIWRKKNQFDVFYILDGLYSYQHCYKQCIFLPFLASLMFQVRTHSSKIAAVIHTLGFASYSVGKRLTPQKHLYFPMMSSGHFPVPVIFSVYQHIFLSSEFCQATIRCSRPVEVSFLSCHYTGFCQRN